MEQEIASQIVGLGGSTDFSLWSLFLRADFVVKSVTDFNTFTATTTSALTSPAFILKHGLSSNEALSSSGGENIGVRG